MANKSFYESHSIPDPAFPVIFHYDTVTAKSFFISHWHENIELLLFVKGEAKLLLNAESIYAKPGDIIVINSNCLHSITSITEKAEYYCLIIDKSLYKNIGISIENYIFKNKIQSNYITSKFNNIDFETKTNPKFYKAMVISEVTSIIVELVRKHDLSHNANTSITKSPQEEIVKESINYINKNICEDITLEDLVKHVGYSKYYFCRSFKKVTGMTVTSYINFIRCQNARNLLAMNNCTVSEAAFGSGFQNISYFTKKYKEIMGTLPSKDRKS